MIDTLLKLQPADRSGVMKFYIMEKVLSKVGTQDSTDDFLGLILEQMQTSIVDELKKLSLETLLMTLEDINGSSFAQLYHLDQDNFQSSDEGDFYSTSFCAALGYLICEQIPLKLKELMCSKNILKDLDAMSFKSLKILEQKALDSNFASTYPNNASSFLRSIGTAIEKKLPIMALIEHLNAYKSLCYQFYDKDTDKKISIIDELIYKLNGKGGSQNKLLDVYQQLNNPNTMALLCATPEASSIIETIYNIIKACLKSSEKSRLTMELFPNKRESKSSHQNVEIELQPKMLPRSQ